METKIASISKAGDFTIAICEDGKVWAKGDLALSKNRDQWEEVSCPPKSAGRVVDIKQIDMHIVALCETGRIYTKDFLFNPFSDVWEEIDSYPPEANPSH